MMLNASVGVVITLLMMGMIQGAALANMPQHPFVVLDNKELSELRDELSRPGWKSDLYRMPGVDDTKFTAAGMKSSADTWVKRDIVIPEYGGHGHHFFCDDGTKLVSAQNYPFAPGPYQCPSCGKSYSGEKYEGARRLEVHDLLSRAAADLALVYAIEKKPEYADKCAEILLKYAEVFPGPREGHVKGGMMYQSLNEAVWVIKLAGAYDLVYNHLKEDERVKIEKFLRDVAYGLQKSGTGGNWASWHLSAVGVVGYATHDQALVDWSIKLFRKQIHKELGSDGIWPESVHTYHFYVIHAFVNLAEAARHAGVDLYSWEPLPGKSFLTMFSAPLNYAYPDFRLPAINDGWFNAYLPADMYELAYRQTGDPRFAWVIENTREGTSPAGVAGWDNRQIKRSGRYAFFFGKDLPKNIEKPELPSADYSVLGIAALRVPDDSSMLTFHYGPFFGHGHHSRMSITLFANGRLWSADYGTSGYGSSITGWHKSTFSHNTVIVDNKGQAATKDRKASVWPDDGLSEGVESETNAAYAGVSHTRTVCRVGGYYVVRDRLTSSESHTYDFYLHADGRLILDDRREDQQPFEVPSHWIKDARVWNAGDVLQGRWEWASQAVEFWMYGSSPILPVTASCPAETGSRSIPLLIARQTGSSVEFVTLIYPHRGKDTLKVTRQDGKLTIVHGNTEDTLTFSNNRQRPAVTRKQL